MEKRLEWGDRRMGSKRVRAALLAAIAMNMILIFCFSAQTGEQSSAASGAVTEFVLRIAEPDFERLPPARRQAVLERTGLIVCKLAHFKEFMLLGGLAAAYLTVDGRPRRRGLWAWAFATLYACTDELHQMFVADRGPSPVDVGIDSAGALAGALIALGVMALLRRRQP